MVKTLLVSLSAIAFFGLASTSLAQPTNLASSAIYHHSATLKLIDDANDDGSDDQSQGASNGDNSQSQDQSNGDNSQSQDQSNGDDSNQQGDDDSSDED